MQIVDHYAPDASHPVVFIGMSWGAMYATWFIDHYGSYGGRIRGAVLSEPGAVTKAQLDAYMKRLTSVNFLDARLNDLTWIGQFMSGGDHARADYMFTIEGLTNWPAVHCDDANNPEPRWRSGAVAAKAIQDLATDGFDWTTNLKSFTPKVLFLRSELNEANRLQDQQALAAAQSALGEAARQEGLADPCLQDAWGQGFKLVARKGANPTGQAQFDAMSRAEQESPMALWLKGFRSYEPIGYEWRSHHCQPEGLIVLVNRTDHPITLQLQMRFRTTFKGAAELRIDAGEQWRDVFEIANDTKPPVYARTLTLEPGRHKVHFHCTPKINVLPTDSRREIFTVQDFRMAEVPAGGQ